MERLVRFSLLVAAAIHAVPVVGVLSTERLTGLYAIPFAGADLEILMRHRAVLFGIVAGILVLGAFRPAYRSLAIVVGFASVIPFLALVVSVGGHNAAIGRIFAADVVALGLLALAALAEWRRANP